MERLISWVEIPSENFDRAVGFYSAVFDIKFDIKQSGSVKFAYLPNNEGAIFSTPDHKPSDHGVLVNFNVGNSLDETIERIEDNGGIIVKPRTKTQSGGEGYYALFIDSEGNKVGLNGR